MECDSVQQDNVDACVEGRGILGGIVVVVKLDAVTDERGDLGLVRGVDDVLHGQPVSLDESMNQHAVGFMDAPPAWPFMRLGSRRDNAHAMACVMVPTQQPHCRP
jgi:hypothetical protein